MNLKKKLNFITSHYPKFIFGFFVLLLSFSYLRIFAIGSPYQPGATLDPACQPGEVNCIVSYDLTFFKQDGNSFSGTATLGTNDSNPLVFETNGSERMRILSSGEVGIGTASPQGPLHVSGTDASIFQRSDGGQNALAIYRSSNIASNDVRFLFQLNTATNVRRSVASVNGILESATAGVESGALSFNVTAPGATFPNIEVMRMTTAGKVGIGTASPSGALDVTGSVSSSNLTRLSVASAITSSTGDYGTLSLVNTNTTNNNYNTISFSDDGASFASWIQGVYTDHTNNYGDIAFGTRSSAGISEKMRILSNGNVGIGTTSPTQGRLVSVSDSNAIGLALLARATSDDYSQIDFYNNAGTVKQAYMGTQKIGTNGGAIYFGSKPDGGAIAERMRINSAGNVAIGTTTPFASNTAAASLWVGVQNGNNGNIISGGGYATLGKIASGGYGSVGTNYYLDSSNALRRVYADTVALIDFNNGFLFKTAATSTADSAISLTTVWTMPTNTGHFVPGTANTYDIGTSSTTVRSGYFGTSVVSPRFSTDSYRTDLGGTLAALVSAGSSGSGYPGIGYNVAFQATVNTYNYRLSDTAYMIGFGGPSGDRMMFNVATAGTLGNAITWTEAMTIKSNGYVGIGNTNPQSKLHVTGGGIRVSGTTDIIIGADAYAAGAGIYTLASQKLSLGTNNSATPSMTLDASGNVGIGTIAPVAKLEVDVTDATAYSSSAQDIATTAFDTIQLTNTNASAAITSINFSTRTSSSGIGRFGLVRTGSGIGDFFWQVRNGGSVAPEVMRLTGAGLLGIGTTPSYKLHVALVSDNGGNANNVHFGTGTYGITMGNGSGSGFWPYITGAGQDSNDPGLALFGTVAVAADSGTDPAVQISGSRIGGTSLATRPILGIYNNLGTPKVLVDKDGQVGISNTTPGYLLHVGSGSVTTGTTVARFQNAGGTCDVVPSTAGGITCTSDETLKKNIAGLNDSILEKVLHLRPVSYNMTVETEGTPSHIGFLAQELELIFPDLVRTDRDGFKSVSYAGLTPYIIKAVQEMDLKMVNIGDLEKDNSLRTSMLAWFGNVSNGIEAFFSRKVTTETLCVKDQDGETCLTRSQINSLLQGQSNNPSGGSTGGSSTGDITPPSDEPGGGEEVVQEENSTEEPVVQENTPAEQGPSDTVTPENPTI
jgi:trimeric autotransporter adhesin